MTAPPPDRLPDAALDALRRVWGFDAFRAGQAEAVAAALAGRDVLAVLPTGGGKSLVYQVPPVATRGLALVVSPLVALMHDQVEALRARGVAAARVHAGLSARAADQLWTDTEFGRYRVVYLTPERLETELFRARAPRLPVTLFAVDEAHCISEWGHDFRPAYRRIADARALLATHPPLVAVTATATPEVRHDIASQLGLRDPAVVVQGFDRPNLVWSVHRVDDAHAQVRAVLEGVPGAALLYAGTRRATDAWAERLRAEGIAAAPYHAGLDATTRETVQRQWLAGTTRVVVATSAFGMGIDKPDVRAVIHVALPPTLEAYYQEAGRAGRDGKRAYAALVVRPGDDRLPRRLAETSHPTPEAVQAVYAAAGSVAQVALGGQPEGPTPLDLAVVARVAGVPLPTARAAVDRLADAGAWEVLPHAAGSLWLRVRASPSAVVAQAGARAAAFAEALVRQLPREAFGGWARVRVPALAQATGRPADRVLAALAHLRARALVETRAGDDALLLAWTLPRSSKAALDAAALLRARTRAHARVDDVVAYVEALGCRRRFLRAYFGEPSPPACGRCDTCLGRGRLATIGPDDEADLRAVLMAVGASAPRDAWLPGARVQRRDALADWLLAEGYLELVEPLGGTCALTERGRRHLARTAFGP